LAGSTPEALTGMLTALGYRAALSDTGATFYIRRSRRPGKSENRRGQQRPSEGPFAKLRELRSAR
jgi:hypothetical protein